MGLKFETLCIVLTAACVLFFALFLGLSSFYVSTYGVTPTVSSDFMARRAAPILLGVAVMVWILRRTQDTVVQKAVCFGGAVIFFGIALTGLAAYAQGVASGTILLAALSEILIAGYLFLYGRAR